MTPGRPGRPRGFDQDTVLTEAMDLFWRRAYAQVSVPELSACTGLSTSSIYNTFGSKHDLYLAALDCYLAMTDRLMLAPMSAGRAGLDDIRAFLRRLAAAAAPTEGARGCLVTKAIAEFGDSDPEVGARTRRYRQKLRTALTAALRRAAERGELPADEVDGRATALLGLVIAYNLLVGAGVPHHESDAVLAAATALLAPVGTVGSPTATGTAE